MSAPASAHLPAEPVPVPAPPPPQQQPAEPQPDSISGDKAAERLAEAIRQLIRDELKNLGSTERTPDHARRPGAFWSVVLFTDFVLFAMILVQVSLEGANLKTLMDFLPLLSGLLFFLLPHIRKKLDNFSQNVMFRAASLALLGPLILGAFPLIRVPVRVLPMGTPIRVNGTAQAYDNDEIRLRARSMYSVSLEPTDTSLQARSYQLGLTDALTHWIHGTPTEWPLWYEVAFVSLATPDVKLRLTRKGHFPEELLNQAKAYHYVRDGNEKAVLITEFSQGGKEGNIRASRILPHGTYNIEITRAGYTSALIANYEVNAFTARIDLPELTREGAARKMNHK